MRKTAINLKFVAENGALIAKIGEFLKNTSFRCTLKIDKAGRISTIGSSKNRWL
jgi:hypothetical protein